VASSAAESGVASAPAGGGARGRPEGGPQALAETKALLAALGPVSPEGYAEAGSLSFGRTAAGPEAMEGIAAFREKRKPAWAV